MILLVLCSLVLAARGELDGFSFNNPKGHTIEVRDRSNVFYSSSDVMGSVKFYSSESYVTVQVVDKSRGRKVILTKYFDVYGDAKTSSGKYCYYGLVVDKSSFRHFRSSRSSKLCTRDDKKDFYNDIVIFENMSDHPFYPAFANAGEVSYPHYGSSHQVVARPEQFDLDTIQGYVQPGEMRLYVSEDAFTSHHLPKVEALALAVKDPYREYLLCTYKSRPARFASSSSVGRVRYYSGYHYKCMYEFTEGDESAIGNDDSSEDDEHHHHTEDQLADGNQRLREANKALKKALNQMASKTL